MGKLYEQLSLSERVYLQAQLELGFKAAAIAAALKRSASTISRELRRNGYLGSVQSFSHFRSCLLLSTVVGFGCFALQAPMGACKAKGSSDGH